MPASNSALALSERREIAYELFMKGWTQAAVAQRLNVSEDTAARYKREYKERIALIARENPSMLIEVVQNTIVALEENDQIRKHAWADFEACDGMEVECPHCEGSMILPPRPSQTRNSYLKTILQAQEQRAKLYGLFGVKAEFYSEVQKIKALQDKLLEFMRRELCATDRAKMERFLGDYMQEPALDLPALPAETSG